MLLSLQVSQPTKLNNVSINIIMLRKIAKFSNYPLTTISLNFSNTRAPNDCLQYLTGRSGAVSSLNWPTVMLTDQLYTICVRRESGYCGIEWMADSTTSPDSFQLSSDTITASAPDALTVSLPLMHSVSLWSHDLSFLTKNFCISEIPQWIFMLWDSF